LVVDDLLASFDRLLPSAATAVSARGDAIRPELRDADLEDPDGNLIELIQPAP
jgi:hypothetical protein